MTSGAGGIGHLAVQLARLEGAGTIIATAGSAAKLTILPELGADVAVSHGHPAWADEVSSAVPGGIDVALDSIGGAALHASIGLLAPRGRVVVYGAASGDLTSVPARNLFGLKTVTGFSLMAWQAADRARAQADIADLAGLLASGDLRAITQSLPLADVVQAHQMLEDRMFPWPPRPGALIQLDPSHR